MATRPSAEVVGWDVGGAHVKIARVSGRGQLLSVEQHACPLWQGLDHLDTLLNAIDDRHELATHRHALTMTGELVDIFKSRQQGVRSLLRQFARHAGKANVSVYNIGEGLRSIDHAVRRTATVASANWHATALFTANRLSDALLIDIGSTTTDISPVSRGRVITRGQSDGERLRHDELIYTGVVRTPIMALTDRLAFAGESQNIAAEWFASTADAYLLTRQLKQAHCQSVTADAAGLSDIDCARRLARMLGRDLEEGTISQWRHVARQIADIQRHKIRLAVEKSLSRWRTESAVHIVGAGCGRFIARQLARQIRVPYLEFSQLLQVPKRFSDMANVCATAVVMARMAFES